MPNNVRPEIIKLQDETKDLFEGCLALKNPVDDTQYDKSRDYLTSVDSGFSTISTMEPFTDEERTIVIDIDKDSKSTLDVIKKFDEDRKMLLKNEYDQQMKQDENVASVNNSISETIKGIQSNQGASLDDLFGDSLINPAISTPVQPTQPAAVSQMSDSFYTNEEPSQQMKDESMSNAQSASQDLGRARVLAGPGAKPKNPFAFNA
ncbi:MAG: hypothetical protein K5666_04705 [Bacilli bacterium]|nr:hypothetical protein [Bacilli bacterium]